MKTIFPSERPFVKDGRVYMPRDIVLACDTQPKITAKEWLYLLYKDVHGEKAIRELFSRTTIWRIKKSLARKGYL